MHKKLLSVGAASALVLTGLSAPLAANAALPTVPRESGPELVTTDVNVTVLLKDQAKTGSAANEQAVKDSQRELIKRLGEKYGLKVKRQFGYLVNGFSATVPGTAIPAISEEEGVASVVREQLYYPTDAHADELTQATRVAKERAQKGEGQVIAIVDTGIDVAHPDLKLDGMNADGSCGEEALKYVKIKKVQPGFTCKVPGGYNFADSSLLVKDTVSAEPHGQHVAGIAAANGEVDGKPANATVDGRVTGSAPNAQLLAMKVFSNVPEIAGGAANDNILAALESSGKLGATVVNLSLGSPNGFTDSRDGIALAIKKLTDQGISVIISAGNSGLSASNSGGITNDWGTIDNGSVGGPSTSPTALSIASVDNTITLQTSARTSGASPELDFPYSHATGTVPSGPIQLVNANLGRTEDFEGKNLSGKYALIQRGAISFADKFTNAQNAGAEGVVLYNHQAGGNEFVGMAGVDGFKFFSATLRHDDGAALAAALEKNPELTVTFSEKLVEVAVETALQPSSFTSWGPSPSLDFKPQLAGIGGNVYSTLNDGKYGNMSGTSMSAPNVAGLSALINAEYAKRFPQMSPAERLKLSQVALMNTAQVLKHDGVPYSVRQVGAGLAQVDDAIRNQVFATVDGQAAAALREVKGSKNFTVKLENRGDKDFKFTVPTPKVVNEVGTDGAPVTTVFSKTDSLNVLKDTVVVPAGKSAEVQLTLNVSGANHFAHGYVEFTSADPEAQPTLHMPFLAFAGDWNAEPIIQAPGDGLFQEVYAVNTPAGVQVNPTRTLLGIYDKVPSPKLAAGSENPWVSPNGDGYHDEILPILAQQRNAAMLEMNIVDESGKRLVRVGETYGERRNTGQRIAPRPLANFSNVIYDGFYNAKVFNPAALGYEPLPDGQYYYQLLARLSDDQPWQETKLPFRVDSHAPVVSDTFVRLTDSGALVGATVTDETSGVVDNETDKCKNDDVCGVTFFTPSGQKLPVLKRGDRYFTLAEQAAKVPYVVIVAVDVAGNITQKNIPVAGNSALTVDGYELIQDQDLGAKFVLVKDGKLRLSGEIIDEKGSKIVKVRVNGADATIARNSKGNFWKSEVALTEGENTVTIEGLDSADAVKATTVLKFNYDGTAPEVTITSAVRLGEDGRPVLDNEGRVHVTGTYSDNSGKQGKVQAVGTTAVDTVDGRWELDVPVSAGDTRITVVATDAAGNSTKVTSAEEWASAATPNAAPTEVSLTFDGAYQQSEQIFAYDTTYDGIDWEAKTLTVTGKLSSEVAHLRVTPAAQAVSTAKDQPGEMVVSETIEATLGQVDAAGRQSYKVTLPLAKTLVAYRFEAVNAEGEVLMDRSYSLFADRELPKVNFTEPKLKNLKLLTNADEVKLAGKVSDNGAGYVVRVNGNTVRRNMDIQLPGSEVNARAFDWTIKTDDNPILFIEVGDMADNAWRSLIAVEKDVKLPEVAYEGVSELEVVRDPAKVTFKANSTDTNNESLTLSLDGKEVASDRNSFVETTIDEMLVHPMLFNLIMGSLDMSDAQGVKASDTPEMATSENPDAPVDGSRDGLASSNTFLPNDELPEIRAKLAVEHVPADAEAGVHTYQVLSVDAAGNRVNKEVTFLVDRAPVISGPEKLTLEVNLEELDDAAALAKKVLEAYEVTDDLSTPEVTGQFTNDVVAEGENHFTVVAADGKGDPATKDVVVDLKVREHTHTGEGVTFTGKTRSDDELTFKVEQITPDLTRVTIRNKDGMRAVTGTVSVPAAPGTRVYAVLDGVRTELTAAYEDGKLVFTGSSRMVYELEAAPTPENPDPQFKLVRAVPNTPYTGPFKDVKTTAPFAGEIAWMKASGLSKGWADGTYRPFNSIDRGAMAAFMYRLAGAPAVKSAPGTAFKDVPAGAAFEREIAWMKEAGISTGWADGTYRPHANVSRAAMAAFMYRFAQTVPHQVAPALAKLKVTAPDAADSVFTDVNGSHQFALPIKWMAEAKISTGWPDGSYRPDQNVERGAMAAFVYRLANNYEAQ